MKRTDEITISMRIWKWEDIADGMDCLHAYRRGWKRLAKELTNRIQAAQSNEKAMEGIGNKPIKRNAGGEMKCEKMCANCYYWKGIIPDRKRCTNLKSENFDLFLDGFDGCDKFKKGGRYEAQR